MDDSILDSIKKLLGIDASYTAYDPDVMMHINSVFSVLSQMGVGPTGGFMIEDNVPTWAAFIGDDEELNMVKTYIHQRVKLLFDPPSTSFAIEAIEKTSEELGWRLNVKREEVAWTDPSL